MKSAINNSEAAKIKKFMKMKISVEEMSRTLLVTEECIKRNIKHFSRSTAEVDAAAKKSEAMKRAAKTRALKKQTQELAEAAAEAEVEETID